MPIIKPKIGRIVHYVQKVDTQEDGEVPNTNPGMIVQVYEDSVVDLVVFHGNGLYFPKKVPFSRDESARQTWHWPKLIGDEN